MYNFCEYIMTFLIFALSQNGALINVGYKVTIIIEFILINTLNDIQGVF
jgi:hypothetical protein